MGFDVCLAGYSRAIDEAMQLSRGFDDIAQSTSRLSRIGDIEGVSGGGLAYLTGSRFRPGTVAIDAKHPDTFPRHEGGGRLADAARCADDGDIVGFLGKIAHRHLLRL